MIRTWHVELVVVATILATVAIAAGASPVHWLGSAAVLAGFAHAQVADRLAEREAARAVPSVDCWASLRRYLLAKEILWAAYFVALRSWPALVGVAVFLLYPAWRVAWRRRFPVRSS